MTTDALLEELGIEASARPHVATWLRLLGEWNARIDLTAARGERELADLMLADAALLAKHVPEGARVVDVGTGAGAPGLALALLRPDLDITLAEPLGKRASFLRTVVGTLGRADVKILRERADALVKSAGRRGETPRPHDVAISRATLPPAEWVPIGLALADTAWVLLAKEEPPSLPEEEAEVVANISYTWPLTAAQRRAVAFRNTGSRAAR